jgi:hypothetical protein
MPPESSVVIGQQEAAFVWRLPVVLKKMYAG